VQSLNKMWVFPVAWWLVWISFQGWFLFHSGWNVEVAFADSLVSNILLAALCTGILYSVQYNRPDLKRIVVLFAGILFSSLLWVWLCAQILTGIFDTNPDYAEFLEKTQIIRFMIGFFLITLFALFGWISYFIKEQLDEKNRANEVIRLARESELIHLRQQLQPHFLFNTLNSVNALIGSNPVAAKRMILQLSDFLRGTLKKEDDKPVPLSEEINYLNLYLEIEKVRFGNRLNAIIRIDPEIAEHPVPVFLLQPLVENAIKFGLYDTIDQVRIEINASKKDPFLEVRISNPFDATTTAAVPGTGFGLNAVSRRLFLLFSRTDLLDVNSMDNTFTVTLKIPLSYV